MNKDITWITSISKTLYETKIYGRCLDTWHFLPGKKILFSEEGLDLDGFDYIDLDQLMENTGYLIEKKRPQVHRRFYRKAYSIYWALKTVDTKYVAWLDSDVEISKPVDVFPEFNEAYASMFHARSEKNLQNPTVFYDSGVDTGLIIFDLEKLPKEFPEEYISYWHDETIWNLEKGKDTQVLCDMTKEYQPYNLIDNRKIYPPGSNWFEYTIFKDHFIHHIGKTKK